MALPQLDSLPMEVLQAIGHFLDASHVPSVGSLSLVSRTCRRAAASALFRRLVVHITSPRRLAEDVERWYQILLANDSLRYVRNVVVKGDMYRHLSQRGDGTDTDAATSTLESFEIDEPWESLAKFIEQLSGLKDVHFHCNATMPSCLLAALHSGNLSRCRLHLTTFRLRSLLDRAFLALPRPMVLAPEDLAIIKSPNLHAISIINKPVWARKSDYHPEAVFEIVARACPKLREIELVQTRLKGLRRGRINRPYPGLEFDEIDGASIRPPGSKAALTSLSLRGRQPQLQRWQQHTDFAVLRTLKMTGYREADVLHWATHSAHFPALSSLEIQTPETDASSVADFLSSVPGLQDLSIAGTVSDSTMMTIKHTHGLTLQYLAIPGWTCSTDGLTSLRGACSHLSSLAVKVRRTQGDASEVAIYTALGTFPKLQTLSLDLDCAIDLKSRSHADSTTSTKTTNVQSTLINCAIDSKLAASIFDRISGAKPRSSTPLHSLKLKVVDAGVMLADGNSSGAHEASRAKVYGHFTRQWACSLHPRDDWQNGVVVAEQEASRIIRERMWLLGAQLPGLGESEEAFRGLWPDMGGDWRDEWRSFGLVD